MTHDAEANAAFIYLVDKIENGEAVESHAADIEMCGASIVVEFDADKKILGIDVSGADLALRPETIAAATDITRRS